MSKNLVQKFINTLFPAPKEKQSFTTCLIHKILSNSEIVTKQLTISLFRKHLLTSHAPWIEKTLCQKWPLPWEEKRCPLKNNTVIFHDSFIWGIKWNQKHATQSKTTTSTSLMLLFPNLALYGKHKTMCHSQNHTQAAHTATWTKLLVNLCQHGQRWIYQRLLNIRKFTFDIV